jgi:hypothetical protein
MKPSFHSTCQFSSKLISWQASVSNSTLHSSLFDYSVLLYAAEHFFVTTLHGSTENTASIVKKACLLSNCLAIDVLLLRALACAGICLPSRFLAMGIRVIIHIVACYATVDTVQIVSWFIYILTQLFVPLCHIYTAYNLTCQYFIPSYFITHFK